jgi:hypothetical protein
MTIKQLLDSVTFDEILPHLINNSVSFPDFGLTDLGVFS